MSFNILHSTKNVVDEVWNGYPKQRTANDDAVSTFRILKFSDFVGGWFKRKKYKVLVAPAFPKSAPQSVWLEFLEISTCERMLRKFSGKSENCKVLKTRTNQPKVLKIPRPKSNDAEQYGNFSSRGVPLFPKVLKTVPVHSWNFRNFILSVQLLLYLYLPQSKFLFVSKT